MNLLGNETSPYLLQHKDNPVHWMPWGDAAFARARAENKPVLLSVGYAACHWCHVMAHESFEDAATADLMNNNYISIKVDREERPDIDAIYQQALALMGVQGGWPLTMFLTPDKKAFWGGTYFPPHPRHGMPAFREVLRGVAKGYAGEKEKIDHNTHSILQALQALQEQSGGVSLLPEHLDAVGRALMQYTDPANGGFGTAQAPKFPNIPALFLLWDYHIRTGHTGARKSVIHALTALCQGGIYDHAGGGFARYTVDAQWAIPHFEKMLYDSAQIIDLLTEVWRETKNPLFAARISQTADFLLREMRVTQDSGHAFAASLDADSDDGHGDKTEGAFYTWTLSGIDAALEKDDARLAHDVFDITDAGNWPDMPGISVLTRLKEPHWRGDAEELHVQAICKKLRAYRDRHRLRPARDDKILADWNGLAIAALAKAGFYMQRPDWQGATAVAFSFITTHLTADGTGALYHSYCAGKAQHAAMLDDYAFMAAAAISLYEYTGEESYLQAAQRWVGILRMDFEDRANGGFFMTSAAARDVPLRLRHADDKATPAGNAAAANVLMRLFILTGDMLYKDAAEKTVRAFSGQIQQHLFPRASLVREGFFIASPLSLFITAGDGAQALRDVLSGLSLPHLCMKQNAGPQDLPPHHPEGISTVGTQAKAYICAGQTCLPAVSDPDAFREMLRGARAYTKRATANDG